MNLTLRSESVGSDQMSGGNYLSAQFLWEVLRIE